ncbi:MAG: DUF4922 domain-containing protein [Ignavibacteria bacterium]|nr:DUF4922 domain-containing protein [Ignavibacteria bacterium]
MGLFEKDRNISFSEAAKELLRNQIKDWEMCQSGYRTLSTVEVKEFHFDGYTIKVQCNPGRIVSTSAKVDSTSIKERKCFLCIDNLPTPQNGIKYNNDFQILVNPFPIFNEHFTLPSLLHQPQQIETSFETLLEFSKDLGERYMVFYNGPKCGASAPDHLHFQAGEKGFITMDTDFSVIKEKYGTRILHTNEIEITTIDDGLRKFLSIEGSDKTNIAASFKKFLNLYKDFKKTKEEPMMNILSSYDLSELRWRVVIFLREKHRPSHFFEQGEKQILLSPAAVDIGGVCITPRQSDFKKINRENITEIFNEVFINSDEFKTLSETLRLSFN